jgi:hypothetical protein
MIKISHSTTFVTLTSDADGSIIDDLTAVEALTLAMELVGAAYRIDPRAVQTNLTTMITDLLGSPT